jgi:hypothetical protein
MVGRAKLHWIVAQIFFAALMPAYCLAQVTVTGHVVDENDAPVREAVVTMRQAGAAASLAQAQTGPTGAFTIALPAPGNYLVNVDREGFYALRDRPVQIQAPTQELTLTINTVREVFQSVNVDEPTSSLEPAESSNRSRLTGTEVNDIQYANSHSLRNGLRLLPGVLQDPTGQLHVNGSSENQVLYLLNGFNLTNPISGQLQTTLAVEGIRSIDLYSGRYSPEYGKGTAGVLSIDTVNGTDKLHYTATNFIPGVSIQNGLRLGNWYPRFGVSGPIVRGRAWFSDMVDFEYNQGLVKGLPSDANTRSGWVGSNVLHTQTNLTSANILYADFLVNVDNEGRVGLGPLNPAPATSQINTRQYLGSIKDQISFRRGALIEFGYAHNNFSNTQAPQGPALYVISPQGNTGNYFVNANQTASRDEGLVHAYLPRVDFLRQHQFEAGADADLLHYNGDFHRTGYQVLGVSGQLITQTIFGAPASFTVRDKDAAWWLLDTWHIARRFEATPGIRQEWDQRVGRSAWSPRVGFAWSPFTSERTRVSGGYSITHDAATLDLFGRPFDQIAFTTAFVNGAPAGPPQPTTFTTANTHLVLPRASNWNLNVDHQLLPNIHLSAKYVRRRGTDEFAFLNTADPNAPPSLLPLPAGNAAGTYQLTNLRRDDFDSVQFSARQTFSGQYEWMASYTRSRAKTNAVIDSNTPQPLQILPYFAPMPWDAPNRLLAWTYLPLPLRNWAISAMADMRSGFPYSVRDQTGLVLGPFNSFRFPLNFDLNLSIERMVILRGYRFALRGGVNNLTNQSNATAVNNVVGIPNFRQLLGGEGRHFVVRIRFFGRADAAAGAPRANQTSTKTPSPPFDRTPVIDTGPLPLASIYGNTGLWKVFTADTLRPHQIAVSSWYDRINRNPGDLVVSAFGFGGAIGITSRIEFGISFEANRDVETGRQDQLSFGQQALGFYGDKTPASPPLASELVSGSSKVPQLRSPATPAGQLTGAAGYYDLFPFAGLVKSASAAGDILFGLKIKLLSESNGAPFSLAVRPYFDLPIHKAITFLMTHPVGTADLQGGVDAIVSRNIGPAELIVNAGYRYISQPAHVSVFQLAKEAPLGFGVRIPRSARIQLIAESTADLFIGAHTPNTTFGAQDPVDLTLGLRSDFLHKFNLSAGYRRPLNQFGGDKNGFVVALGYVRR